MKKSPPVNKNASEKTSIKKSLIVCGILSSVWYVLINIYVPTRYEGYNISSFTVSELSAIGAPTRDLWVGLATLYPILFGAFGWGVIHAGERNRYLRIVGSLILFYSAFNLYWPPMHQRGTPPTLTDILHIAWAVVTILFMLALMGFGATALGKSFRIYTIISVVTFIVFGTLTSTEAPNIPTNGPTPRIGIWERINIGVFMSWVIVFAVILLTREKTAAVGNENGKGR
jgi:hypothetical protein